MPATLTVSGTTEYYFRSSGEGVLSYLHGDGWWWYMDGFWNNKVIVKFWAWVLSIIFWYMDGFDNNNWGGGKCPLSANPPGGPYKSAKTLIFFYKSDLLSIHAFLFIRIFFIRITRLKLTKIKNFLRIMPRLRFCKFSQKVELQKIELE